MPILSYPMGPLEVNCYLYHNGTDAIIIDPAGNNQGDVAELLRVLDENKLTLRAILLTHLHFDHAYGCAALQKATGLTVYAAQEDMDAADMLLRSASRFGLPNVEEFSFTALEAGESDFGSIHCKIFHVPGHSPGSLVYYIEEEKAVFTGDVLFYLSIGRTDLYGGDFATLKKHIKEKLYTLPADTRVYPGHGLESSIGFEEDRNPYVNKHVI